MNRNCLLILLLAIALTNNTNGQNPIIRHIYTADPAARVFNDTLYLYTSHDEDTATWFNMLDWRLFSTVDMKTWTDHGAIFSLNDISWASKAAWAPEEMNSGTNHHSIVNFNGEWYLFYHNSDLYFQKHPREKPVLNWKGKNPFRRSVCVDRLYYNNDGTIRQVIPGKGAFSVSEGR